MTDTSSREVEAGRNRRLEAELAQANARLREVDHRIKNDLQLIASLFLLQLRRAPEGPERETVRAALDRINAVLAVHRRLDPVHDSGRLDASLLVRDVAEEAVGGARRDELSLELELAPLSLPARHGAPLALIVGELVRNALRHAFPARAGRIRVALKRCGGRVELCVADDGIGCSAPPDGFGAALVGLLAKQLRGACEWTAGPPGVRALVRFPDGS